MIYGYEELGSNLSQSHCRNSKSVATWNSPGQGVGWQHLNSITTNNHLVQARFLGWNEPRYFRMGNMSLGPQERGMYPYPTVFAMVLRGQDIRLLKLICYIKRKAICPILTLAQSGSLYAIWI